jgi:hypothetical protein
MPFDFKPGTALKVTINKAIKREAARKTLERLFMTDNAVSGPIHAREKNFKDKPKRRGGRIWTKRPEQGPPDARPGQGGHDQGHAAGPEGPRQRVGRRRGAGRLSLTPCGSSSDTKFGRLRAGRLETKTGRAAHKPHARFFVPGAPHLPFAR